MRLARLGLFGTNGHQPTGLVTRDDRVSVVGAADIPAERVAEWREKTPGAYSEAKPYGSLAEMLAEARPDLVSVCSARRDEQHEHIVAALEAGAHVYAEKPLATTLDGLAAIRAAAERAGKQVRAMTPMMYSPGFLEIKGLIDAGELGDVVQVFAQKSYPYHDGRPQDVGIDGGLLMQAGIHAVSIVRHVTGLDFHEVFAMDTGRGNPVAGDLKIGGQIVARLTGGALCTIVCNYCNPKGIGFWGNDQLRVHGTGGMAEVMDAGHRSLVALSDAEPRPLADPCVGGYGELFLAYVAHLLDGSPMLLSQGDSLRDTEIVIRAQESADRGIMVRA